MKDIVLKKQLLENGKYLDYQKNKFILYKNNQIRRLWDSERTPYYEINFDIEEDKLIYVNEIYNTYELLKEKMDLNYKEYKACKQLQNCKNIQRTEIKRHLIFWIKMGYEITFNTYTLNNKTLYIYADSNLENTKELQDKLTRLLHKHTEDYIGNVDYGKQNGRLHYHVLQANKIGAIKEEIIKGEEPYIRTPINIEWDKYGFSNTELIKYTDKSYKRLSSYLAKLTNHSIKIKANRLFIKKDTEYKKFRKNYKSSAILDRKKSQSFLAIMKQCNLEKSYEMAIDWWLENYVNKEPEHNLETKEIIDLIKIV